MVEPARGMLVSETSRFSLRRIVQARRAEPFDVHGVTLRGAEPRLDSGIS